MLISLVTTMTLVSSSCKKDNGPTGAGAAALTIVNAMPASSPIIANINNQLPYFISQISVPYGSAQLYRFAGGNTSVSLTQSSDTTNHVFQGSSFNLTVNTVHSFFISGNVLSPDTLLVEDILNSPAGHPGPSDSTTEIRFVNLSAGSSPISINIQGNANGSEVNSLQYRSITEFKSYDATSSIANYTFEFRDQGTGNLLATYFLDGVNAAFNTVLFKNLTIVFAGDSGSQTTFLVNNW